MSKEIRIEPRLPAEGWEGDDISFLQGATILRAGTLVQDEEEMFVIEFRREGEEPKLLCMGFSEVGLWIRPY